MKPQVLLRLGSHAEKEYFVKTASHFDGVVFGANLLESTAGATASLIIKLCGNSNSLPYFIDPMTYAFGTYVDSETGSSRSDLDWIKSDQKAGRAFKRSYRLLADQLGVTFTDAIRESKAITPDKLASAQPIRNVLDYQKSRLRQILSTDEELREFAGQMPDPKVLLTPYFYQDPLNGEADLDAALEIVRLSLSVEKDDPVHAVICADATHLSNESYLDKLASGLQESAPAGVWLWFSRFDEYKATETQLRNFVCLVKRLSLRSEVYNMHGSFFSLALCNFGLTGVMHGVGYGEQKDVVPVIGQSTPWVSYYLPPCHARLSVAEIERCFRTLQIADTQSFYENVCDCAICKGVVRKSLDDFGQFGDTHRSTAESVRSSQTPAAAKRCRFHFLLNRINEKKWLAQRSKEEIIGRLENATSTWMLQHVEGKLQHLFRWRNVLRDA